jgi:hypothetical protein
MGEKVEEDEDENGGEELARGELRSGGLQRDVVYLC